MGYYTNYNIYLEDGPEEEFAKMLKDIDDILGCGDMSAFEAVYAKWYSMGEDMDRLSRKYPDITVRIYGDGEESDDLWQTFWHNGRQFSERVHFAGYNDIKDKLN